MDHYNFISKTDNKSLFNQIKFLVTCAKESYQNDLAARREHLKQLLDAEEKVYENEFVGNIKSRVDENIRQRQQSLLAMKQERTKEIEKFVASKMVHQNMQNCIEIREELRKKDYRETQLCQLEQMDDKLRAIARERKDDEFWLKAQKKITDDIDRKQQHEEKLKRALQVNQCRILDRQLEEHRRMIQMDLKHSSDGKIALDEKIKAANRADKERYHANYIAKSRDMKAALNTICQQRQLLQQEAETFEDVFHEETMRQVRLEMEEALHKNDGVKEAVSDYLNYIKKFKHFTADLNKRRDDICEEMGRRFICYKNAPKRGIVEKKRQIAESTHKSLLKQICEEQARKAKLEALEKENKILENRFARLQVRDKIKEREKIRKGLDMQLEVIARLNEEKEKKFQEKLNRAEQDQMYCEQLLNRHKSDGIDYLPPHPNWKLLACYKGDCKQVDKKDSK